MEIFELNNKQTIPAVGFGVFMIPNDGPTYDATLAALKAGYRHIDTAAGYMNESDVGKAIKDSGVDRKEVFITSKLWLQDYGYENAKKGIETSLKLLGVDYIDLYLLHQPYGDYLGAWKALEEAYQEGKIKSIGISNITVNLWNKFKNGNGVYQGTISDYFEIYYEVTFDEFPEKNNYYLAKITQIKTGYYGWILNSDFTLNTKAMLTKIRLREITQK